MNNLLNPLTNSKGLYIIIFIGIIVYFKIFFNGFVWDDETFIIFNPQIQHFDLFNLIGQNLFNSNPFYRPIPAIYFSLLYLVFSNNPFFYHFLQLGLHILNTFLLYLLFSKYINKKLSLLLSLIFLIHPINVESVAYIAATQSEIYLLFGLMALRIGLNEKIKRKKYLILHLWLFLALLTKEVSILFFLLIYFYRLISRYRISKLLIVYSVSTILIYLVMRYSVVGVGLESIHKIPIAQLSFIERLINIPAILLFYIQGFFIPSKFAIDQLWTVTTLNTDKFYIPLIIDIFFYGALSGLIFYSYYRHKEDLKLLLFFLLWYLAGVGMLLQIFPLDMTVADRWFYFPIIGLLGIIGITLENIIGKEKNNFYVYIFMSIFILFLSFMTFIRIDDWRTPFTLYEHDLAIYDGPFIEQAYGLDLGDASKYDEAIVHLKKSISIYKEESAIANLATTYQRKGDYSNALYYYDQAMQLGVIRNGEKQHYEDTYTHYVYMLYQVHQFDKARNIAEE